MGTLVIDAVHTSEVPQTLVADTIISSEIIVTHDRSLQLDHCYLEHTLGDHTVHSSQILVHHDRPLQPDHEHFECNPNPGSSANQLPRNLDTADSKKSHKNNDLPITFQI